MTNANETNSMRFSGIEADLRKLSNFVYRETNYDKTIRDTSDKIKDLMKSELEKL